MRRRRRRENWKWRADNAVFSFGNELSLVFTTHHSRHRMPYIVFRSRLSFAAFLFIFITSWMCDRFLVEEMHCRASQRCHKEHSLLRRALFICLQTCYNIKVKTRQDSPSSTSQRLENYPCFHSHRKPSRCNRLLFCASRLYEMSFLKYWL
jgi:hypothetical protein